MWLFSTKVVIIVVVVLRIFYCTTVIYSAKPNLYFDRLPFKFINLLSFCSLCIYDMTIVLLKWNGQMLMKWLRAVLGMLFMYLCPHLVRRQTLKTPRAARASVFHEFTLTFNLIANSKHILACCPGGGLRARNMARTQRTPPSLMWDKID